jgi:hypothetical protein
MSNGYGLGTTVVTIPNRPHRQATRERVVDLFRIRVKLPPRQHLAYKAVTMGSRREAWRLVPSPSFVRNAGDGRVHVNLTYDFRLYPASAGILGPGFPFELEGKTVVADGLIERVHLPSSEIYVPISLFITERPLSSAQWELSFPQIKRESDRRDGDIEIPNTAHVIRKISLREINKTAAPAIV